ncbi:MAG: DUF503 domain-containing protein [Myxococcales bacterium]|jgi:uncharacterized protein YlxP (DUF503 family)|nr:DUF503 domain-containing protein [Myxococcales bacterium]
MFVAVARIALAIPEAHSLKGKRQVVNKIVERVRAHFNAAIAEMGDNDVWQRAILGVAVVTNHQAFAQSSIDKILAFIETLYVAPIVSRAVEIVPLGEALFGEPEWDRLEAKIAAELEGKCERAQEQETWPGVRTLADIEGDDPDVATFRAVPPTPKQRGAKAKSIKSMNEDERAKALDALLAQMKRPKDSSEDS